MGIKVEGKINDASFDALIALLENKMESHPQIRIYVEIESFGGAFPKTFFKDLKFALDNWKRFDREAIVTGKEWLKNYGMGRQNLF